MVGKGILHAVSSRGWLVVFALLALVAANQVAAAVDDHDAGHADALRIAHEGNTGAALTKFRELLAQSPADRRLRYD